MDTVSCVRDRVYDATVIRADTARIACAGPSLFDPTDPALRAIAVSQGGRQAAWFVQGSFGSAVLRHYRRGGLMARVNQSSYLWTGAQSTRSFAEFDLLSFMVQAGLPVPRPLAACYRRTGLLYRAAIVIEQIPQAHTLATILKQGHHDTVARAVCAMHDAGVWHADLNAYNILVDPPGQAWLIDFDKGRRITMTPHHRQANLLRLQRSLIKIAGHQGKLWWDRFNHSYMQQASPLLPPS